MDLTYHFNENDYDNSEEFVYEISHSNLSDYLNGLDGDELLDIIKELFLKLKDEDKKFYLSQFELPAKETYGEMMPDFEQEIFNKDSRDYMIDILMTHDDLLYEVHGDIITHAFEDAAYEEYKDRCDDYPNWY